MAAVGALVFNGLAVMATNRQLAITLETNYAERYSKAVEQLGSDSINVRLGGIYALGTLMRNSSVDKPTIVEVLAAFVRDTLSHRPEALPAADRYERPKVDVAAALEVLAARISPDDAPYEPDRVDMWLANVNGMGLARSDFRLFDFTAANMARADLRFCDFSRAVLQEVRLVGSKLYDAQMSNAVLARADATDADLSLANMQGAWLMETVLRRADMNGADLTGATLTNAILVGADLSDADLTGADLTNADLRGATLRKADLQGATLQGARLDGADTTGARGLPTPGAN